MILESGKIDISTLRNGCVFQERSFQTNSDQFIKSHWIQGDETKFVTSDSQDNLYMWDVSKGITPHFSTRSKAGTVLEISQFNSRSNVLLTLTDKNTLQMSAYKIRREVSGP